MLSLAALLGSSSVSPEALVHLHGRPAGPLGLIQARVRRTFRSGIPKVNRPVCLLGQGTLGGCTEQLLLHLGLQGQGAPCLYSFNVGGTGGFVQYLDLECGALFAPKAAAGVGARFAAQGWGWSS